MGPDDLFLRMYAGQATKTDKNLLKIIGELYDEVPQLRLSVKPNDQYLPELHL